MAFKDKYTKLNNTLLKLRKDVLMMLKSEIKALGGNIEITSEVEEKTDTEIAYFKGNNPQYKKLKKIKYDKENDDIVVYFNNGHKQSLNENIIDDLFIVAEIILISK